MSKVYQKMGVQGDVSASLIFSILLMKWQRPLLHSPGDECKVYQLINNQQENYK